MLCKTDTHAGTIWQHTLATKGTLPAAAAAAGCEPPFPASSAGGRAAELASGAGAGPAVSDDAGLEAGGAWEGGFHAGSSSHTISVSSSPLSL